MDLLFSERDRDNLKRINVWFAKQNFKETRNHRTNIRSNDRPEQDDYEPTPKERLWKIICDEYPHASHQVLEQILQIVWQNAMKPYRPEIPKSVPLPPEPNQFLIDRRNARLDLKRKMKHRRR